MQLATTMAAYLLLVGMGATCKAATGFDVEEHAASVTDMSAAARSRKIVFNVIGFAAKPRKSRAARARGATCRASRTPRQPRFPCYFDAPTRPGSDSQSPGSGDSMP